MTAQLPVITLLVITRGVSSSTGATDWGRNYTVIACNYITRQYKITTLAPIHKTVRLHSVPASLPTSAEVRTAVRATCCVASDTGA